MRRAPWAETPPMTTRVNHSHNLHCRANSRGVPLGIFCTNCRHRATVAPELVDALRATCGCSTASGSVAPSAASGVPGRPSSCSTCLIDGTKSTSSLALSKPKPKPNPLVMQLLRATAKAGKGKPAPFWVGVDDLDLPDSRERIEAAVVAAALHGWLNVGGRPAHSITITAAGRKQISR